MTEQEYLEVKRWLGEVQTLLNVSSAIIVMPPLMWGGLQKQIDFAKSAVEEYEAANAYPIRLHP